jgi:prevent-host-death family protein
VTVLGDGGAGGDRGDGRDRGGGDRDGRDGGDRGGLACSFCGRSAGDVERLVAGGARAGTAICGGCLHLALETLEAHAEPSPLSTIGVRELRNQVAAVVRRAAGGERIVVTVDGRPMAQLAPLTPAGQPTLADLAATGLLDAPQKARPLAPPSAEDLAVDVRLDRVMDELRGR